MRILAVALLIAVLSGMGVGGGGLLVIYLTLFENVPQIAAQGTNLVFFIATALASTIYNAKKRRIAWKQTIALSIFGVVFSVITSLFASEINPDILRKLFGGMLILSGGASLFSSFVQNKQKKNI